MPKPYEDDYRSAVRDEMATTLAARQSPVGYGLEQAGKSFGAIPPVYAGVPQHSVQGIGAPSMPLAGGTLTMGGTLEGLERKRPIGGMQLQYKRRF